MSGPPEIAVRLGRCDDMRAEVYVRPSGDVRPGTRLVGSLTGPYRGHEATLPAAVRLDSLPDLAGAAPVARAILTEPAYWTPESPNLYRLEARLDGSDVTPLASDMRVGLRRLGVRGRSFWLDGRRWVPRAAAGSDDVSAAKRADVGLVTDGADEHLLAAADERGVAVVISLEPSELTTARVAALARHPSALLAVIISHGGPESLVSAVTAVRPAKGTMQIGIAVDATSPAQVISEAFDFVAVTLPAGGVPDDAWRTPPLRPLVAWRRNTSVDPHATRAACDTLQRDLAAWGLAGGGDRLPWDWAGYLVG